MARRRDVRTAFYDELETAVTGLVNADDVTQENPGSEEDLPAVVHNDSYRRVPMNRSAAPTDVTTDSIGEQSYIYSRMMQAVFTTTVLAADEGVKEDIYEAVRTHFEQYTTPLADASSIQSDVHRVEVADVNSTDTEDRDPVLRGDALTIRLGYERTYSLDTDPMTDVDTNISVSTNITADDVILQSALRDDSTRTHVEDVRDHDGTGLLHIVNNLDVSTTVSIYGTRAEDASARDDRHLLEQITLGADDVAAETLEDPWEYLIFDVTPQAVPSTGTFDIYGIFDTTVDTTDITYTVN